MDESYLHRCFASTGEVVVLLICVDVCVYVLHCVLIVCMLEFVMS